MRKRSSLIVVVFLGLLFIFASAPKNKLWDIKDVEDMNGAKLHIDHREFPLYFIANKGQVNEKAAYYARAAGYTLWLTKQGLIFDSMKSQSAERRDVSRFVFVNANRNPEMVPMEQAKHRVNYFKGNDPAKWHCDISTSMAVLYKNLYKNIDLKVYGIEKQIEYDWIVNPGGNPGDIRFQYKNVKGTRIDEKGNLLIDTDFGELMHKRPVSYQWIGMGRGAWSMEHGAWGMEKKEGRREVDVQFKKIAKNTYGFDVGAYDRSRELIIDPVVLAYSTYLGGGSNEQGRGIAVDGSGCVYVTGRTLSTDFPTQNPYQTDQTSTDVFVTKIDTTQSGGASLIYSTYLGGGSYEEGYGIAVDGSGNAYVTGYTNSTNFPTLNQYQTDPMDTNDDVFVTKIAADGASLLYSTYLGGGSYEEGFGIAVDGSGNAYVTGYTNSTDFPTLNQYQANQTGLDVFVTKIDTTQNGSASLIYSTYLGGGNTDQGNRIAVDGSSNAYVTGSTLSADFPTRNPYQADQTGTDAFVTKIDTTQSGSASLIYSTYLGGGAGDQGFGIAVDGSGRAYVTGYTDSTDFPTLNPYQTNQTDTDVFVTKIAAGGSSIVYSTYLGGGNGDYGYGLAIDGSGSAYVTGYTNSTDFPILNQNQSDPADSNTDAFVTKIDTTQTGSASLIYSTYLGGGAGDRGFGIAVDGSGNAYVTGDTTSTDFPTTNQYQGSNQGGEDVFVTTISAYPAPPTVDTPTSADITPTTATLGGNVSSINGANVTERGVYWSTTDGFTPPGQGTKVSETGNWGTGAFTVAVSGLPPGSDIYFRAFATNSVGTGYTAQDSFPTPPIPPTVTTDAVTNITSTTATCGGNVTSNGGAAVTARGVCWSTSPNPTTADSLTTDGPGTGTFTSAITGLTPGTRYYVRAYAVNSAGTSYGSEVPFDTSDNPTISGRIAAGSTGIGGVTLTFSNGGGSTSSLSDGTYSHTVNYGWSGTVTPAKDGYTFSPSSRSYQNVISAQAGQDYTAAAITPVISGKVTTNGTGVPGVTLTFSNGGGSTTTASDGSYSHAVSYGWSGTVTPAKDGYTFSPSNRSYQNVISTQADQDYTAAAITPVISGKVTSSGTGVPGVTLTFSNEGGSTTTASDGSYSHAVSYGWSGTVTPAKDGYTFSPSSRSYQNVISTQADQDYTAAAITPVISGKVTTNGTGVPGVTLTFSNGEGSTTTVSDGTYSHTVSYGWSGTVTPTKDGYTFSPSSRSYQNVISTQVDQDYTAAAITPVISGKVTTNGTGVPGVTLTFSSGGGSTTTASDGSYSHAVSYGWSGTVTPTKGGYTFSPSSRSYQNVISSQAGQDYTAAAITPVISGEVTSNGTGVPGVTLTFSNNGGRTVTGSNGSYEHTVDYGWSGTVTPSKDRYTFSPSSRSYQNVISGQAGQDYTAIPIPPVISGRVVRSTTSGMEGFPGVRLTFTNRGGGTQTVTTDADGYYQHDVPYQWSGDVTPSKTGYDFFPSHQSYTDVTTDRPRQDYTAAPTIIPAVSISGTVTNASGAGIPGVVLTFSNGGEYAVSDSNGQYDHTVDSGWSGSVTPTKSGYSFDPPHRSYEKVASDLTNENYTAAEVPVVISGKVTDSQGTGISGVILTFSHSGGGEETTTTDFNGFYQREVPHGWSGEVTPSKQGYEFQPPARTYESVTSDRPDQDYTADTTYPVISGTVADPEGTGVPGVTLTFSGDSGFSSTADTDADGNYSHPVEPGWSGTASPFKTGYIFSPSHLSYNNVTSHRPGEDYTAEANSPVISGIVTAPAGWGIPGVRLEFSGAAGTGYTYTNTAGTYTNAVPVGWTGTVTPIKKGYEFSPPDRSYENINAHQPGQDFVTTSMLLFISGKVTTPEGEGIAFVTLTFSNQGGSTTTDRNGGYVHPVDYLWSGTVTPSKSGYTFSPPQKAYPTVTGSHYDQDYTAHEILPVISGRVTHPTSAGILGLPGVNLVFSNGGGTTETDAGGYYKKEVLKGWTGTATPGKQGFVFWPTFYYYPDVRTDKPGQYYTAVSSGYTLTLTAERKESGSLTIKKQYGQITLTAERTGHTPAARYIVYRKENSGRYQQNKVITAVQLRDGETYTYTDGYLEPGKTYTYKAEARNSAGQVIGVSEEKEI